MFKKRVPDEILLMLPNKLIHMEGYTGCVIIVFVWSQYDGGNIEQRTIEKLVKHANEKSTNLFEE